MLAQPERALHVIRAARRARGIRKPGAFAITRWRQNRARASYQAPLEPDLLSGAEPPDLAALEYVWSRPETVTQALIEKLLAAAIVQHGGLAAFTSMAIPNKPQTAARS